MESKNKVSFISGFDKFETIYQREHPTQDGSIAIDGIGFASNVETEEVNDTFRILYRLNDEAVSNSQLVFNKVVDGYDASQDVKIAYDVENSIVYGFSYLDEEGNIYVLTGPMAARYFFMFMGMYKNKGESRTRKD